MKHKINLHLKDGDVNVDAKILFDFVMSNRHIDLKKLTKEEFLKEILIDRL